MIIKKLFKKVIVKLGVLLYNVNNDIARASLPRFGNNPKKLKIDLPRRIINPEYIFPGDNITLGPGALLNAITKYPSMSMQHPENQKVAQEFSPRIKIGNRVTSTGNLQLTAMKEIIIEDDVMFASNINIVDGLHGYDDANEPYKYQKMFRIAPIRIKRGSWIGQNVVILPGVTIGAFSIIGANSVVTKSIPERSIAVGAPARVIKSWDNNERQWISLAHVNSYGVI